jgi:hypothetical protein
MSRAVERMFQTPVKRTLTIEKEQAGGLAPKWQVKKSGGTPSTRAQK